MGQNVMMSNALMVIGKSSRTELRRHDERIWFDE